MKLLMLKGLPGSGKTTWAKQFIMQNPGWVRINKDSLREMMGSYRPGKDEDLIVKWRDKCITEALHMQKNVIVDDTNFHQKHEYRLREIAHTYDVEFEEHFVDTPLDQCIANDLKRPDSVGEKVIRKMWRDYLYKKYPAPEFNPSLPNALICDLDGTFALHNGRSPYDVEKCDTDLRNDIVFKILWWWRESNARYILFVTGREEKYKEKTMTWLNKNIKVNEANKVQLFMRPTGDSRKDFIVKEEIYLTKILGKYNVKFVLDDRNQVVDMWRRNGLTCFQVADGDF